MREDAFKVLLAHCEANHVHVRLVPPQHRHRELVRIDA